jgi:hypothetical protein
MAVRENQNVARDDGSLMSYARRMRSACSIHCRNTDCMKGNPPFVQIRDLGKPSQNELRGAGHKQIIRAYRSGGLRKAALSSASRTLDSRSNAYPTKKGRNSPAGAKWMWT